MGKGAQATTSSETTTTNVDKSITSEADVFALQDTNVTIEGGGSVTLITKDPGAAVAAIEAMNRQSESFIEAAGTITSGSNQIAREVAKSQEQFVATASGQTATLKTVAIVGAVAVGILVLPSLLKRT